ncbi:MAG: hypothetical protein FWG92_04025 [Leptospirales bacterium]|nr:hypothetical protein [Leptospirales bacterium]
MSRAIKSIVASAITVVFCVFGVEAFAESYTTQSINGATGLIVTPTAHVGWQGKNTIGIDGGYHLLPDHNGWGMVPKVTASFFGRGEVGAAWDAQFRDSPNKKNEQDIWLHGKFKIYSDPCCAFAIGGNLQWLDINNDRTEGRVFQLYLAYTFAQNIFNMPVETTFVVGKTMSVDRIKAGYRKRGNERQLYIRTDKNDPYSRKGDIDFSVGFDFDLFPQYFKHYVHWVTDFANYSYSADPMGALPRYRATGNTGLRFIPSKAIAKNKNAAWKWNVDIYLMDFFDHNREWAIGTTLGFAF